MRVYLSGSMAGRPGDDVVTERQFAATLCQLKGLTPLDPALTEHIDRSREIDLQLDYVTMKQFVAKDEYLLTTADIMLVLTGDTPSDGTWHEMGKAIWDLRIPVVMVAPKRVSGDLMGFSNVKVDAMFPTVEDAVEFICKNYKEI